MNALIERFMNSLTKDQVLNFANSKEIFLNSEELEFAYTFIKKNYKNILSNPTLLNMDLYKNKFSKDNYLKINKLINEYYTKYHNIIKSTF